MTNCAYDEMYLPLAQRVMGDMYDYAVNTLGMTLASFQNYGKRKMCISQLNVVCTLFSPKLIL